MKPQGPKSIQGPLLRGLAGRSATGQNIKQLQKKCGFESWGLDVEKIFLPFRRGEVFFT
jgi:hypothetical protein